MKTKHLIVSFSLGWGNIFITQVSCSLGCRMYVPSKCQQGAAPWEMAWQSLEKSTVELPSHPLSALPAVQPDGSADPLRQPY